MEDSKCDYPAACNAMETLLVHKDIFNSPSFNSLTSSLKERGVTLHPGPRLAALLPIQSGSVSSLHTEYGGLECSVEVVDTVEEAVEIINTHGSSHTDTVITEDGERVCQREGGRGGRGREGVEEGREWREGGRAIVDVFHQVLLLFL